MLDDAVRAAAAARKAAERHWPGAEVGRPQAVPGDASSRRYLRVPLAGGAEPPPTVVVMLNEGSGAALSSDELGVFGDEGPSELPFVNVHRYLAARTDAVPHVYFWEADFSAVVLEDVGDVSLWQAAVADPNRAETLFARALEWLAELQTRARDDGSGCYAFRQQFDSRLFAWELEHFIEYGARDARTSAIAAAREELGALADRLGSLDRVFAHRDFHAWNIHVDKGRLRVLDFQDALLAPPFYDVASLLTDRTTPRLVDRAMRERLLERYLLAAPPEATRAAADAFVLCALQRVLKVIGRFHYLAEVKGKPRYAAMLPEVVSTATQLLAEIDGFSATRELVAESAAGVQSCV